MTQANRIEKIKERRKTPSYDIYREWEEDIPFLIGELEKYKRALEFSQKRFSELPGICDREESYDDHCRENGGRLTSPIREIKAGLLTWYRDTEDKIKSILAKESE